MSASYSKWIKLNVGGQYFQTTLTTLLSCPDSLLAKMFDPESGLQPAYSEDGVYFLDTDPKYFSIILNWLRYKEVMDDSDVNLSNVVKAAQFFGLQELVVALETKQLADELKKKGAVVIVANESDARKKYGHCMGFYIKQTDIAYRQAGGEMYLYQAPDGVWHVSNTMDGEEGDLRNPTATKSKIVPYMGWEYRQYKQGQYDWHYDDDLKIIVPEELKMCNTITLSFPESVRKEFLGKYHRICGDWVNGWPIFKNQEGNYLQVPLGESDWSLGTLRDCGEDNISINSNGVTTCPANKKKWTVYLSGEKEKWKIMCDVHGNSN